MIRFVSALAVCESGNKRLLRLVIIAPPYGINDRHRHQQLLLSKSQLREQANAIYSLHTDKWRLSVSQVTHCAHSESSSVNTEAASFRPLLKRACSLRCNRVQWPVFTLHARAVNCNKCLTSAHTPATKLKQGASSCCLVSPPCNFYRPIAARFTLCSNWLVFLKQGAWSASLLTHISCFTDELVVANHNDCMIT